MPDCADRKTTNEVRDLFVGRGFHEVRSVPFVPEGRSADGRIPLRKPLSTAEGFLRTDLVPVLLGRLEHNWSRGHRDIRLFEVGTVFRRRTDEPGGLPPDPTPEQRDAANPFSEERRFAFVFTGGRAPAHWSGDSPDCDVWDLIGIVEDLAQAFDLGAVEPGAAANELTRPHARTRSVAGRFGGSRRAVDGLSGVAGRVADTRVDAPRWSAPVFAGEFRVDSIRGSVAPSIGPSAVSVGLRDVAFTLATSVSSR